MTRLLGSGQCYPSPPSASVPSGSKDGLPPEQGPKGWSFLVATPVSPLPPKPAGKTRSYGSTRNIPAPLCQFSSGCSTTKERKGPEAKVWGMFPGRRRREGSAAPSQAGAFDLWGDWGCKNCSPGMPGIWHLEAEAGGRTAESLRPAWIT